MKLNIYIDGNNLYRAAQELGFYIDYKKFRGWLRQKYNPNNVFLFIGRIPQRTSFYQYLQESGFILIFKQTISIEGTVKGNCDAELVLKVVSDFYTHNTDSFILVTGDGDFGCLVEFLQQNNVFNRILAPHREKVSFLLRNKTEQITFLTDHYHKFSVQKEKAPGADVSTQGSFS